MNFKASEFNFFTQPSIAIPNEQTRAQGMLRHLTENAVKVVRLYRVLFKLNLEAACSVLDNWNWIWTPIEYLNEIKGRNSYNITKITPQISTHNNNNDEYEYSNNVKTAKNTCASTAEFFPSRRK